MAAGVANPARIGLAAILVVIPGCASATAAPATDYPRLAQSIDEAVAKKHLPSVVAVMFDDRGILWSHIAGYSDVERRTAPSLRTRYRLGSMAKAVTSTVLAIAKQRGLISFNSTARVRSGEAFRPATLSNLTNMQAGLAQAVCYQGITGDADPDPDCGPGFDYRFNVQMTDGAGRYSYSNMGPQLAANVLAGRLKKPFEQIAQELLFVPAGMTGMTYDHARSAASRAASYDRDGKPYEHDFRILPEAGAGLEASAEDLVRFGQLHLTGRAADGRELLSPATLAQLHSAPNGGFYGYGWGRIGAGTPMEVLISDGQVNGGQAMLLIDPLRHVGAVVVSNSAHDEVSELALNALDTIVPGISASFNANVQKAQAAHEAKVSAFSPPRHFAERGFVLARGKRIPIKLIARGDRLTAVIAGRRSEQAQSEVDEAFRGWGIPCPQPISACRRPGATAKLWLSRDRKGLSGQLQVTSLTGQFPFAVRVVPLDPTRRR